MCNCLVNDVCSVLNNLYGEHPFLFSLAIIVIVGVVDAICDRIMKD